MKTARPALLTPHLVLVALGFIRGMVPPGASAQIQVGIKGPPGAAITVTGPAGTPVQVQRAEGLPGSWRWSHLGHTVLAGGPATVNDPNAAAPVARFYRAVAVPSTNMVLVPSGALQMGDAFGEGVANELPLHTVFLNAFYIERSEVTFEHWTTVYQWAITNGYFFDHSGLGKAPNHPVHSINWFDAVKWCNARSEMERLTPAYYMDTSFVTVYRVGQASLWTNFVRWSANGYRLPTEAEWEQAARAGAAGQRFPWGDLISHQFANYYSTAAYAYDVSATRTYHPLYSSTTLPYTNPIDAFAPNSYGIYGMADNICEWCWDWFDESWYAKAAASLNNTRGPRGDSLTYRVRRGGSWNVWPNKARNAFRDFGSPTDATTAFGFRCARSL